MSRCLQSLVAVTAFTLPALAQTEWQRLPLLEHTSDTAFAFDTIRDVAVLFGGKTNSDTIDTTWIWDRVSWSRANTAHTPPARHSANMVFDPVRCVMVLFGGRDGNNNYLGDTWLFDGVDWSQATPTHSPSPRMRHAMTFDATNATVLLFGGSASGAPEMQDTWEWNGSNWLQRTPVHQPPIRSGARLAYDTARNRAVLFGGSCFQFGPCWRGDTWEWDGIDWTDHSPTWPTASPPQRWLHGMAFDAARQRVVVFAGSDEPNHYKDDLWEWDGTAWVERTVLPKPPARLGFGFTYDPVAQRTLAFGGEAWLGRRSDLWSFDGIAWHEDATAMQPPLPVVHDYEASTFDGDRSVVVWFGRSVATPPMQTWEWNGAHWSKRTFAVQPDGSRDHRMQWLPRQHHVALYQPRRNLLPDQTWTYDGSNWTLLAPTNSPDVREGFDTALDVDFTRLLLFGGRDLQGLRDSTWAFDNGDWQQLTPTTQPSAREGHCMALDAHRGRIVLFGGDDSSSLLADTFEWDGQQWTQRQPATTPPGRREHTMSYDVGRRRIVMHGGISSGGYLDDTWEWDGNDWQQRTTATSFRSFRHTLAHDFEHGETIAFGGYGDGTWSYRPTTPASFAKFGSGCAGSLGPLSITTPLGELPYTDGPFTVAFGNLPGTIAFAAAGLSNTQWNGVALPINMQALGAPGCDLLVAAESLVALPVVAGIATWTLHLPANPALLGTSLYQQALVLDPAGPHGLAMTPGSESVVGGR